MYAICFKNDPCGSVPSVGVGNRWSRWQTNMAACVAAAATCWNGWNYVWMVFFVRSVHIQSFWHHLLFQLYCTGDDDGERPQSTNYQHEKTPLFFRKSVRVLRVCGFLQTAFVHMFTNLFVVFSLEVFVKPSNHKRALSVLRFSFVLSPHFVLKVGADFCEF